MRARAENACIAPIARDDIPSCAGARHRVCGAGGRRRTPKVHTTCARADVPVCVVPEPGACSACHELPSRYDAPNTCTVHVVMHLQLRWRARAHGTDGQRSGCDVWEVGVCRLTFLPLASAPADGVVRAPVSAACVSALRTPLGTLTTRSAPRACAAATLGPPTSLTFHKFPPFCDGSLEKTFSFIVNSV